MFDITMGSQKLPRRYCFLTNRTLLGIIIMKSIDMRFYCMPRPEHLAALGTPVAGVEVVPLDMVGQVGEGGVLVLADNTHPGHGPRLVPIFGGHR